jgi:chromosome segregation ATPase
VAQKLIEPTIAEILFALGDLRERIAKIEGRFELYAPFEWVHEKLTPVRDSVANLRESLARITTEDEEQARDMEELRTRIDDVFDSVNSIIEGRSADRSDSKEIIAALENKITAVNDEVRRLQSRQFWKRVRTKLRHLPGFSEQGSKVVGFVALLIGFWATVGPWLKPLLTQIMEAFSHAQ